MKRTMAIKAPTIFKNATKGADVDEDDKYVAAKLAGPPSIPCASTPNVSAFDFCFWALPDGRLGATPDLLG